MTEDQEHIQRLEAEVQALEDQSKQLGDDISDTREDWERKQADPKVPGAQGTPASESELPPPEPDETD